jgi:ribosomal protein S18
MALVTVPNRDKNLIIWNFMEELWENYNNAVENSLDTEFKFMDFYNIGLLSQYLTETGVDVLPDKIVVDTLKEYANESGNIKIKGITVELTKKGLIECQKPTHEWD